MEEARADQDPRLTFTTPEFKAAQRTFAANLAVRCRGSPSPPRVTTPQNNFGKKTEWVMVQEHPWSVPRLAKAPVVEE